MFADRRMGDQLEKLQRIGELNNFILGRELLKKNLKT